MKSFLRFFLFFSVAALLLGPAVKANAADKPNVLWIYLEDVSRWFSCYGDKTIKTPNIDALAADGIRFDRFYTPAGVCSATRSSQILGVMQTTFGVHNHRSSRDNAKGTKHEGIGMIHLPDGVETLPEIFSENGYYSVGGGPKDDYNFVFDVNEIYDYLGKGFGPKGGEEKNLWSHAPEGKPWFVQVHIKGGKLGGAAPTVMDRSVVPVPPYYPDIDLVREEIAHHYDTILETDRQVGEVVAALKADEVYDGTVIFLHSDHGYKLHRDKQFLYEGGIGMPLVVTGPGIKAGQVREDLISGVDLAPASLAAAGIEVPDYMEGADFLAKGYEEREFVVAARDRCDNTIEKIRAIVTPRFKYLHNYLTDRPFMQPSYRDPWPVSVKFREMMAAGEMNEDQLVFFGPKKPEEEFYDLENDPHEIHNLIDDPKFAKELKKHRRLLKNWIEETGDQGLATESVEGLLQVYYRWREKCVNPEYDWVRDLAEPVKPLRRPQSGSQRSGSQKAEAKRGKKQSPRAKRVG